MRHAVIVPCHNEAEYLPALLESLAGQEADRIVVVDDNSTDNTAGVARSYDVEVIAAGIRSDSERSYRVVEVVEAGIDHVGSCRYISKIDADMVLPKMYFATLLERMDREGLGCASGVLDEPAGRGWRRFRMPPQHVPGMLKTYRWEALEEAGGLNAGIGWDIIDLVAIRLAGWQTTHFDDLVCQHRRLHGSAVGSWRGGLRMGGGAYRVGTHPLFMAGRSLYRMLDRPYVLAGLALGFGYMGAWWRGDPRVEDRLVEAIRREQLHRLRHRNRLGGDGSSWRQRSPSCEARPK